MIGMLKIIGMLLVMMVLMAISITARATEDEAPVYRHLSPDLVCVKPKDGEEKCYNLQQDRDSHRDCKTRTTTPSASFSCQCLPAADRPSW